MGNAEVEEGSRKVEKTEVEKMRLEVGRGKAERECNVHRVSGLRSEVGG